MVGNSMNTVFSNYFVAKPRFWGEWLQLADGLWDICEKNSSDLANRLNSTGLYSSGSQEASLKVFLQERLTCAILAKPGFTAINLDLSHGLPVNNKLFMQDMRTKKLLNVCDTMKLEYDHAKDEFFDLAYQKCRESILFNDYFNRSKSLWLNSKIA